MRSITPIIRCLVLGKTERSLLLLQRTFIIRKTWMKHMNVIKRVNEARKMNLLTMLTLSKMRKSYRQGLSLYLSRMK